MCRWNAILIQPMIHGVGEVLIGYRVDRDVGPLVMLAAGGLSTEIYRDRALRLAPIDRAEALGDDRRGEGDAPAGRLSRPAGRRS